MNRDSDNLGITQLHQELRRLPQLPAPPSLIPAVLARLQDRATVPWWQRSWANWPPMPRLVATAMGLAGMALLVYAGFAVGPSLARGAAGSPLSQWAGALSDGIRRAALVADAAGVVWRAAAQPFAIALLAVATFMYLACLGVGAAFVRVAARRV